jgi:hypothetical protein
MVARKRTRLAAGLLATVVAWLIISSPPSVSGAHRPAILKDRTPIDNATISWVLAGSFEAGDEVFVVEMNFERDFALPFEILVPRRGKLREHRPWFAVVGPGLPPPSTELSNALPFEVPAGLGVFVERNDRPERYVFFEQVMRRNMWTSGAIAVPLQRGDVEIWIWSPDGSTGEFQFGFGVEEDFSGGGFAPVFSHWCEFAY